MTNEELVAEARERAGYMTLLAKLTKNEPGAVIALEEAGRMTRVADALEASEARVKELEAQVKDFKCEQVFRISEMQELVEAQARIAELEAGIEWEYEYVDDDDPEGNVYGQLRRVVGPWLPVPGGAAS